MSSWSSPILPSMSFMILCLTFRSWSISVNFCSGYMTLGLESFLWVYLVGPAPFVENTFFFGEVSLLLFQRPVNYFYERLFLCSLFCSIDPFFHQYHTALTIMFLLLGGVSPQTLFSLNIELAILDLLPLYTNLESVGQNPQNIFL